MRFFIPNKPLENVASLILWLGLLVLAPVHAADLSRDIREGRLDNSGEVSAFLELGLSVGYEDLPVVGADEVTLGLSFGGHISWRGFFVDVLQESYSGFQIGYSLFNNDFLSVDLLGAVTELSVDDDLSEELDSLRNREPGLNAGIRSTFYRGDNLFQFELLKDATNEHDGYLMSVFAGRSWLYNNWNLHTIIGARYWSQEVLDYFVGVREDEASERFPAYQAESGTVMVAEAGVTYPLNEHWIFRGTVSSWKLSDSIENSPLISGDRYNSILARFVFVY